MYDLRDTFSGVFGAFCCVYAGLPFDVAKIRLQTQSMTVSSSKQIYKGPIHCLYRIVTEEGVLSLWKGAIPALTSSIIENSVLFSANGIIKRVILTKIIHKNKEKKLNLFQTACVGGIAGFFSSTAINPSEVIKCRLQNQKEQIGKGEFTGPFDCLKKTIQREGIKSLFRGLPALWLRDIPFNFIFFGSYETYIKHSMNQFEIKNRNDIHPLLLLGCGGSAGVTSWSIVYPADLIKSRIQTTKDTDNRSKSLLHISKIIYKENGINGFYRGWSAAILRAFPANGSLLLGVELCTRFFHWIDNHVVS